MIILDWRHPFLYCGSLGNIVGCAYATEYIRDKLGFDVGVLIGEWHQQVWGLCLPLNRINPIIEAHDEIRICRPALRTKEKFYHWVQNPVACAGFEMPDHERINPKICWFHSRNSKRVLLYPREYNNKNQLFTLEYWVEVANLLRRNGWSIISILDNQDSHRDGEVSVNWCKLFKEQVKCEYIFSPTIGGLQAAVGLSEIAIGIENGAFWLMLKSTIRQIVTYNPNDPVYYSSANYNAQFIKKSISYISGTSLDWISEL